MKTFVHYRHYIVYYYPKKSCDSTGYWICLPEFEKHIMFDSYKQVLHFKETSGCIITRVVRTTLEEVNFD